MHQCGAERQVVREHAFPDHRLSYTGKVAFRTLIPQSAVAHIPDLPRASTFWHLPDLHVYTDFLDNGLFEIATRANLPEEHGEKVSWGQKIDKEQVVPHYQVITVVANVNLAHCIMLILYRASASRSAKSLTLRTNG